MPFATCGQYRDQHCARLKAGMPAAILTVILAPGQARQMSPADQAAAEGVADACVLYI